MPTFMGIQRGHKNYAGCILLLNLKTKHILLTPPTLS
jgi:hypothetical protein